MTESTLRDRLQRDLWARYEDLGGFMNLRTGEVVPTAEAHATASALWGERFDSNKGANVIFAGDPDWLEYLKTRTPEEHQAHQRELHDAALARAKEQHAQEEGQG